MTEVETYEPLYNNSASPLKKLTPRPTPDSAWYNTPEHLVLTSPYFAGSGAKESSQNYDRKRERDRGRRARAKELENAELARASLQPGS